MSKSFVWFKYSYLVIKVNYQKKIGLIKNHHPKVNGGLYAKFTKFYCPLCQTSRDGWLVEDLEQWKIGWNLSWMGLHVRLQFSDDSYDCKAFQEVRTLTEHDALEKKNISYCRSLPLIKMALTVVSEAATYIINVSPFSSAWSIGSCNNVFLNSVNALSHASIHCMVLYSAFNKRKKACTCQLTLV